MDTDRHNQLCRRHTKPTLQSMTPWRGPCLGPAQHRGPILGPVSGPEQTPRTMSPDSWGTYFGGCKVTPKSGPSSGAVNRRLLLEISGRLHLHVQTKQHSDGADGSQFRQEAIWCVHGKAYLAGGPVVKYKLRYIEGDLSRRPYCVQQGSPTVWEAQYQNLHTHGSQSMPEALWCVYEKPYRAGVPAIRLTVRYMEANPCQRSYGIPMGSPTMREADHQDLHTHGSRSRPEALLCLMGSPTEREAR